MAANVFAERYLYLPSAWLAALACLSGPDGSELRRAAVALALAGISMLYGVRCVTRNRDWRTDEILIVRTLASVPDANLMRANLGTIYWNRGAWRAAEREWLQALELGPNNVVTLNNLGLLRSRQKRHAEAIEFFEKAIHLRPNYMPAHQNLGDLYLDLGRTEDGERELRTAVTLSPLSAVVRNRLGKFLFDSGRLAEAEEQFLLAIKSDPAGESYSRLGDIYLRQGKLDRAEEAFARAASLDPFDSHAHFRLAAFYRACGRSTDAMRQYEAGLETDPTNAEALAGLRQLKAQPPPPAPAER